MSEGPAHRDRPLPELDPRERAARAGSFGNVATQYHRYRPGPPAAALDWALAERPERVVDLGAGTGALTRLLVDRADEVIAVEPDPRMRRVLEAEVPTARALDGRGESLPLDDRSVDAVLASSSWHWMDPVPTLREVERVLVPGGILVALWSGPDPEGAFISRVRQLVASQAGHASSRAVPAAAVNGTDGGRNRTSGMADFILGEVQRPRHTLEIPPGMPFTEPEVRTDSWTVPLEADDLIGLLGTFSRIITMPDDLRERVLGEARRLLRDVLGLEGRATVEVDFRCRTWRARRTG